MGLRNPVVYKSGCKLDDSYSFFIMYQKLNCPFSNDRNGRNVACDVYIISKRMIMYIGTTKSKN